MDLDEENVEVGGNVLLSGMKPGSVKIITEFGDEQILRVAPFSETQSYKLVPLQRPHTRAPYSEVDLSDLSALNHMIFGFDKAQFLTSHCTVRTPTIIESKTPEICETIDSENEWFRISDEENGYVAQTTLDILADTGQCIVEASTLNDVVQRFAFEVD